MTIYDERDRVIEEWQQGRHGCPVGELLRLDRILDRIINSDPIPMSFAGLVRRRVLATESHKELWRSVPDEWTAEQIGIQVCNIVTAEATMARVMGDTVLDVELRQWHAELMANQTWQALGEVSQVDEWRERHWRKAHTPQVTPHGQQAYRDGGVGRGEEPHTPQASRDGLRASWVRGRSGQRRA